MQPREYVALIAFAFTISGKRKPSITMEESLSERTREEWTLIPRGGFLVSVRASDRFLKKLMEILAKQILLMSSPETMSYIFTGRQSRSPSEIGTTNR